MNQPVREVPLRLHPLWLLVGFGLILLLIYLSLTPSPPTVGEFSQSDKLHHLIAYGGLQMWFMQLYAALRARLAIAAGLFLLGVTLEVLQGLGGVRYFEWVDMVANGSGILLALVLVRPPLDRLLIGFERQVFR